MVGLALIPLAAQLATGGAGETRPETPPAGAIECVSCRAPAGDDAADYSESEWDALRGGEILIRREQTERGEAVETGAARAAALIPHSPERVWSVLTDFESWPDFVPLVTRAEVLQRQGTRRWVQVDYRILFVSMQHTTVYDFAPALGELRWSLDRARPHDIADTEGRWQLLPVSAGSSTLVRYRGRLDAGRAVPRFVEDLLARRSLRGLIAGVRAEVERRFGPGEDSG